MTEDNVIIRYDEMSWRDSKEFSKIARRLSAIEDLPPNEFDEMLDAQMLEWQTFISRFVEYVPRDWFVKSAPENLSFSDPSTYDYLKSKRFMDLIQLMNNEEEQSKN